MSALHRLGDRAGLIRRRAENWLMEERHALHGVAAARILLGLSVLGLLISNFGNRQAWVGDASAWADPARAATRFPEAALLDGVSGDVLTVVYVVVMLASLGFVVGWHAKAMNVVVLVGFIAVTAQNPVLGTLGDNLVRIALLWTLLMRTSEVWSFDARADQTREHQDVVPEWWRTSMHNVGLVGLGAQTALAYFSSGLDKASQPEWQDGTALYTTLQLPEFRAFPWLADLLSNGTVVLAALTWTVLAVQLFFVPLLLRSGTRDLVAVLAIGVNVLFGVVLATPWSSLAVIAVTGLFVSDRRWAELGERVLDVVEPISGRTYDVRYAVVDRVEDWWYRYVLGAVDWVRYSVLKR